MCPYDIVNFEFTIVFFAARAATYIKSESGIDLELDSRGRTGEFTVWVDGRLVEEKDKFKFPDKIDQPPAN